MKQDRLEANLIDAQDMFDEEYPPGSRKRAEFEERFQEHCRRRRRWQSTVGFPVNAKAKLVDVLLARRRRTTA